MTQDVSLGSANELEFLNFLARENYGFEAENLKNNIPPLRFDFLLILFPYKSQAEGGL